MNQALESSGYVGELPSHSREEEWFGFRGQLDGDVP